jgi:hypothetical protein
LRLVRKRKLLIPKGVTTFLDFSSAWALGLGTAKSGSFRYFLRTRRHLKAAAPVDSPLAGEGDRPLWRSGSQECFKFSKSVACWQALPGKGSDSPKLTVRKRRRLVAAPITGFIVARGLCVSFAEGG